MPVEELMTYDKNKKRWKIRHKGETYRRTLPQLGFERDAGKTATVQAANEWWRKKLKEIEGLKEKNHPHASAIKELKTRQSVAVQLGLGQEVVTAIQQRIEETETLGENERYLEGISEIGRAIWADRKSRVATVAQNATAVHHVKQFISFHEDRATRGEVAYRSK